MDMKRILQAIDGASTKPVEGANDMSKFLRIVKEEQVPAMPDVSGLQPNQPKDLGDGSKVVLNKDGTVSYSGAWGTYIYNAQGQHIKTQSPTFAGYNQTTNTSGQVTQQNYNAGPMSIQQGPQGTNASYQLGDQELKTQISEGANPHKVALPVQMAMQHYQKPGTEKKQPKTSLISKYFVEAEEAINQAKEEKRQLINQYAHTIAQRVMMKESAVKEAGEAGWGRSGMAGVGLQPIEEVPIEPTADPNDPVVYGHEKANPMSLKGRIMQARKQLQELAQMAEADDLATWQHICKLSKGGMFMGLEQNLEQIRHGIAELAAKRKKGGVASRGIDKDIDEDNDPCWKDYKQIGTKKKGGKTVPNCVPKE